MIQEGGNNALYSIKLTGYQKGYTVTEKGTFKHHQKFEIILNYMIRSMMKT